MRIFVAAATAFLVPSQPVVQHACRASVSEEDSEAWAAVGAKLQQKTTRMASRRRTLLDDHKNRKDMAARGDVYKGDGVLLDNRLEETVVERIGRLALVAATESTGADTESSGTGRYAWGTWVDDDKLAAVMEALDSARLGFDDDDWDRVASYAGVRLVEGTGYEVTLRLFSGEASQLFQFPAGSRVLLKPLYGTVTFQKLRRGRDRELSALGKERKLVGAATTSSETGAVFGALGGPPQTLTAKSRAAVLEVRLRPPTGDAVDEGEVSTELRDLACARLTDGPQEETKKNLAAATAASLRGTVGGLETQLDAIVRRVLASRADPAAARRLGVAHVRGVLLSGPPGCGKTLLARELARALGARDPVVVNGPEILDKFVGEAERKVRDLFLPAESEYAAVGDKSALHVIVLDEMDAIARHRGSLSGDTTGVRDGVVNMLLAKMDGIQECPNVLVVGLTNRPELIDDALKRPGRLEVHVTIDRPDRAGRRDIARIHTRAMRDNGALATDAGDFVDSVADDGLAAETDDFSGAEIAGLVRSAASFALGRAADGGEAIVTRVDLKNALAELTAAAATKTDGIRRRYDAFGIRGTHTDAVRRDLDCLVKNAPTLAVLLAPSAPGAGVTSLAAEAAFNAKVDDVVDFVDFVDAADRRLRDGLDRLFADDRGRALLVLDDVDLLVGDDELPEFRALCRRGDVQILATASSPCIPHSLADVFDVVLQAPAVDTVDDIAAVLEPLVPDDERRARLAHGAAGLELRLGPKRLLTAAVQANAREFVDDADHAQAFETYLRASLRSSRLL